MEKRYFTAMDHDKMVYFQMPKVLMYGEKYKKLSNDAKILYMYCLDLIKVSMMNHGKKDQYGRRQSWKDENGFFIKLSLEKINQLINCKKDKSIRLKKELEQFNLIDQKRVGLSKANLIYVLQLEYTEEDVYVVNEDLESLFEDDFDPGKPRGSSEVVKNDFKESQNQTSRSRKKRTQEVAESDSINTKSINIKPSNTKIINNQSFNLSEEEENNIINDFDPSSNVEVELNAVTQPEVYSTGFEQEAVISENVMFMVLKDVLSNHGVNAKTINRVIQECRDRGLSAFRVNDVTAQLEHMYALLDNNKTIFDFAVYFANGLEERTSNGAFRATTSVILEQITEHLQQAATPKVSFYNWIEERE